jgi:predicted DNA-binding transcriptional regulator AlpA
MLKLEDEYIGLKEVKQVTGLTSTEYIRTMWADKNRTNPMPKPVYPSPRKPRWNKVEFYIWLHGRVNNNEKQRKAGKASGAARKDRNERLAKKSRSSPHAATA